MNRLMIFLLGIKIISISCDLYSTELSISFMVERWTMLYNVTWYVMQLPNVQQENSEKLCSVNLKLKNTFYVSCKYILKVYLNWNIFSLNL